MSVSNSTPSTHTQVLQVSFEAPPGVKRNLQRTYDAWGSSLFSQASPLQAQLLFMLAWFHAIVQERRAYMPQASLGALMPQSHRHLWCSHACNSALEPTWNNHVSAILAWATVICSKSNTSQAPCGLCAINRMYKFIA